LQVENHNF